MIGIDTAAAFFLASVLLGLVPGPDNLFVLTQSAIHGRRSGMVVVLGLCTGLLVHTAAVALGVAALLQTSVYAFTLLKLAGAAYLLWLAWQAFRASARQLTLGKGSRLGLWRLYRRGIFMNVTNPKVSIFFLAFLPQFVTPSNSPAMVQIMQLGGMFILATLLVFGAISLLAGLLGESIARSQRAQKILNRVAGTVFVLLAAKLAVSER